MCADLTHQLVPLMFVLLHEAGKSGTHALRDRQWARRPLIPGLPISDVYHVCSGAQWLIVIWAGLCAWGDPLGPCWRYWAASVVACGVIWPASKALKYPGLTFSTWIRIAFLETWYVQIARTACTGLARCWRSTKLEEDEE